MPAEQRDDDNAALSFFSPCCTSLSVCMLPGPCQGLTYTGLTLLTRLMGAGPGLRRCPPASLTLGGRNLSSSGVRRPFMSSAGGGLREWMMRGFGGEGNIQARLSGHDSAENLLPAQGWPGSSRKRHWYAPGGRSDRMVASWFLQKPDSINRQVAASTIVFSRAAHQ